LAHGRQERHGEKAEPDGAARGPVPVDLSKHVATYIGQGKEELCGTWTKPSDLADFGPDQVRDHQNHNEPKGQQIQIAIRACHSLRISQSG
jgi:hypothetical protein